MPSLVATTSTPARKPFVRTHYVRTNYVYEEEHPLHLDLHPHQLLHHGRVHVLPDYPCYDHQQVDKDDPHYMVNRAIQSNPERFCSIFGYRKWPDNLLSHQVRNILDRVMHS